MIPDRVVAVAKKFKGRFPDDLLEDILHCVREDETWLAFEMVCDFIAEYDVFISMEEYDELMKLAEDMEIDSGYTKYLKEFVKDTLNKSSICDT